MFAPDTASFGVALVGDELGGDDLVIFEAVGDFLQGLLGRLGAIEALGRETAKLFLDLLVFLFLGFRQAVLGAL